MRGTHGLLCLWRPIHEATFAINLKMDLSLPLLNQGLMSDFSLHERNGRSRIGWDDHT